MKKLVAVFVLTALLALPARGPAAPTVADVEGQGLLAFLACGACIGSGVASAATGLGAYYSAIMSLDDGALGYACASACRF